MRRALVFQLYVVLLLVSLAVDVSFASLPFYFINSIRVSVVFVLIGLIFPILFFRPFLRFLQGNRGILILGALFLLSGLASVLSSPFPRPYTLKWLFVYGFVLTASFNLLFLFSIHRGLGMFFLRTVAALAVLLALFSMIEVTNEGLHGFLCDAFRGGERQVLSGQPRAGATLQHPNILGCFLSVGILILVCLRARQGMTKVLFYPGILILSVGMALTGSRNAMLVALIPLVLLLFNRKTTKTVLLVLLIAALPLAGLTPAASRISDVWDLLMETDQEMAVRGDADSTIAILPDPAVAQPNTAVTRLMFWESAARMFMDHPVFGFGPGGYNKAVQTYASDSLRAIEGAKIERGCLNAHNGFFNLLAEFGLVGTIVAVAFLAWTILNLLRRNAKERFSPVYAIVLGFLISFGPDAFFYSKFYMVLFLSTLFLFSFTENALSDGQPAPSEQPVS